MSSPIFRLDNKIALVTGGSRGLGLYAAEGFLQAGASKVYISSRKAKACEEAVKYLNEFAQKNNLPGKAFYIAADLGTREGNEQLLKEYLKQESRLDILVANAGATWGAPLSEHPDSAIEKVLDLNVRGVFSNIQLFAPVLEKSGTSDDPSRIIITGSTIGITAGAEGSVYGYLASKAAVHHLGKNLAVELGPRNITVNIIAPGFFPTKMANGLIEGFGESLVDSNPRRRLGEKRDIIGAVVYLTSPAANYINGTVLPIDGGAHIVQKL